MPLLPPCTTPSALVFLAMKDPKGVMRFPSGKLVPGILITIDPGKPINEVIYEGVESYLGKKLNPTQIDILQDFSEVVSVGGTDFTIYLAKTDELFSCATTTYSEILRSLPADRNRLVFLKAFQMFAGSHKETIKVLEEDPPQG